MLFIHPSPSLSPSSSVVVVVEKDFAAVSREEEGQPPQQQQLGDQAQRDNDACEFVCNDSSV